MARVIPASSRTVSGSVATSSPRGWAMNRLNAVTTDSPGARSRTAPTGAVSNASRPLKTRSSLGAKQYGRLGDVGRPCHIADGHPVEAALREHPPRGVRDRLGLLLLAFPQPRFRTHAAKPNSLRSSHSTYRVTL